MSVGFGFSLPALAQYGGGGNNPFGQLGPTLDLSFAGVVTDTNDPNGYTLNTNFIIPQYQIAAQYVVWETGVGLVDKTFSQIITFTRASTATFFNSAGVLTSAAIDAPRLDYNPSTLAAQGLLIEESRTNSIRNNTMVGAVAGTPGTLPTNWITIGSGLGTLTQQIVGTGTSAGITYIDVKISGTTSTTSFGISFDSLTQIVASSGQTWSGSAWVAQVAGANTNITSLNLRVHERDGAGASLAATGTDVLPTLSGTLTRASVSRTLASASTAYTTADVLFAFASGVAIDITLRIGLPQLELGAFATSVIPTTTTALTRSADVASVNTLSPWFNSATGTIYAEGVTNRPYAAATGGQIAQISDGTANNRMWVAQGNTVANTSTNSVVTTAGTLVADLQYGPTPSANYLNKAAFAYAANDFAGCTGGGTVATDTLGAVPTVTTLYLGISSSLSSASNWNGYLRRIVYYPRRLSNAELQSITS
jgi:hypothetical protein